MDRAALDRLVSFSTDVTELVRDLRHQEESSSFSLEDYELYKNAAADLNAASAQAYGIIEGLAKAAAAKRRRVDAFYTSPTCVYVSRSKSNPPLMDLKPNLSPIFYSMFLIPPFTKWLVGSTSPLTKLLYGAK